MGHGVIGLDKESVCLVLALGRADGQAGGREGGSPPALHPQHPRHNRSSGSVIVGAKKIVVVVGTQA